MRTAPRMVHKNDTYLSSWLIMYYIAYDGISNNKLQILLSIAPFNRILAQQVLYRQAIALYA